MAINPIYYNKIRRFLYADENPVRVIPGNKQREKRDKAPDEKWTGLEYLTFGFTIIMFALLLYINGVLAPSALVEEEITATIKNFWDNSLFGGATSNFTFFWESTITIVITVCFVGFLIYRSIRLLQWVLFQAQPYTMYVQTDQRLFIVERMRSSKLSKPILRFMDYGPGDIFEPQLIDLEGMWQHVIFSDLIESGGAARSDSMLPTRIGFYSIHKAAAIYDDITLWMKHAQSHHVQIVHPELRFRLKIPQNWSIKRTSYPEEEMDNTTLDLVAARMHKEDYVRKIPTSAAPWNTLFITKRIPFEKDKAKNTVVYQTIIIEAISTDDEDSMISKISEGIVSPFIGGESSAGLSSLSQIVQRTILIGSFQSLLETGQDFSAHSGAKKTNLKNKCSSLYMESEFKFGSYNFHLYQAYSTKDDLHFRFTLHSSSAIDDKTAEAFKEIIGSLHFFSPDEELPYPHFLQEKAKRRLTFRDN